MAKLPKGWRLEKIGNLCEVGRGSSPRPITDSKYFEGGTIPWIKIADATKSGKYLYETKEHVNEYGASFSRLMPKGSLIVAASGTLGYTQLLGVDGCVHDGWLYLTNYNGVEKDFLYYFFHAQKEFFFNSAYGAAIQNINTMIMRDMEIALPPLPTQRRIADILSAYDDLIENNTRRIRILEGMAQAIYQEWFGKVDKESLPKGWELKSFSDLVDIDPATPVDKELEKPFVGMNALSETSMIIDLGLVEMRTGNSGAKFQNRDVLFPRITPSVENGKGAFVQFLNDSQVSIGSTEIIVFREKELNAEYIYFLSREHEFRGNAINSMVGASGRQRVQQECFDSFMVAKPPKKLLEEFANIVSPIFQMTHALARKNDNLRRTRDLLLPRLVSGEIEVSKMEIEA